MQKVSFGFPTARIAALVGAIAALAACAPPKPTIHSDFDRNANFAGYRTYSYFNPVGTDKAGYSSLLSQHFKSAIDTEMAARGYKKVDSNPDLLVNFMANKDEKTDIVSTPTTVNMGMGYYGYRGGMYAGMPVYGGTEIDTVRYTVGTANVDVVDAKQKKLIWTGVAEGRLRDDAMKDPQAAIANVIKQIFMDYPGHAAAGN